MRIVSFVAERSRPHASTLQLRSTQKVIQAIKLDGLKIIEASQLFNISRNTIALWLKRQEQTGDFLALPESASG
jgi:transposase